MVRDTLSVDADARIYWPVIVPIEPITDFDYWQHEETCQCPELRLQRGRAECPVCGTVYAVSERRAVRRWKTFTQWNV